MRINQEIRSYNTNSDERYLIVAFNFDHSKVALSDLTIDTPRKPISILVDEVYENIRNRKWEILDHNFDRELFTPESELNELWRKKRDDAIKAISPLIADPLMMERYLFGQSESILTMLIKHSGRSKKYIHVQITKWFRFGGIDNALLPQFYKCGSNHKLPESIKYSKSGAIDISSKPGKRTKYGEPYRQVTQQDIKLIEEFSKTVKPRSQVNKVDLYTTFIVKVMKLGITPKFAIQQNETFEPAEIVPPRRYLISPRSFISYLNRIIPELEWIRKSVGEISYKKDHQGKPGIARKNLRKAGQRFEIDATIADVYIIYPYSDDRLLSCGRPVIFFIIDTYSGMIVGFHVCFDGPNWHGAGQAVFNAFENKVEFCKRWGIDIAESDWPCHSICEELVFDRAGENSDKQLAAILRGKIGITLIKLAAYHRGDTKGTVEKTFDIVVNESIKFDPGAVLKYPIKEDQHASRKPLLDFSDFMKKLIKIIIDRNNFRIKDAHDFYMESTGVGYTARDIWNHFQNHSIPTPPVDTKSIRFALLPEDTATVTERGVLFKGLYYSSSDIEKMRYFDRAKNMGRFKIKVRYTDLTTNHIWFRSDENDEILTLDILDRSEAYKNQIWANVLHRLEIKKHQLAMQENIQFNQEVLLQMELDEIDANAKKRNKKFKKSYAKSPAKDVSKHKATMAEIQRNQEANRLTDDLSASQQSAPENLTERPASAADESAQDLSDPTQNFE